MKRKNRMGLVGAGERKAANRMRRLTLVGLLALLLVSFSAAASAGNGVRSWSSGGPSANDEQGEDEPEELPAECVAKPESCYAQTTSDGITIQNTAKGNKINDYTWAYSETVSYAVCSSTTCSHLGKVYVTARINLNGRQSNWSQSIAPFSGPSQIKGTNKWDCVDDNGSYPNRSCSGGQQSRTASEYNTGAYSSSDSNFHSQDEIYWYNFDYAWKAINYPSWTFSWANWRSWKFACNINYSAGQCRFNQ